MKQYFIPAMVSAIILTVSTSSFAYVTEERVERRDPVSGILAIPGAIVGGAARTTGNALQATGNLVDDTVRPRYRRSYYRTYYPDRPAKRTVTIIEK